MKRQYFLLHLATIGLVLSNQLYADKPNENKQLEIKPMIKMEFKYRNNMRINKNTGIPVALYNVKFKARDNYPEYMAREYLHLNTGQLGIKSDHCELQYISEQKTPGGIRVRFQQFVNGYPVHGADIVVSLNKKNEVIFVMNNYIPVKNLTNEINISNKQAENDVYDYLGLSNYHGETNTELVIYQTTEDFRYAYKINTRPSGDLQGDWEVFVDAKNGIILEATDKAFYLNGEEGHIGSGWVFDPDVAGCTGNMYGEAGIKDNNDEDSDILTANLVEVELRDIAYDPVQKLYQLNGPYAQIVDIEAPFTGLYNNVSSNFHFTRSDDHFEAVNIYYHIDKSMRYVNDTLGFAVRPTAYEGGVKYDPNGLNGLVNAMYISSKDVLVFGSPDNYVDMGEDYAIVLHELGHGIHDWITNGHISNFEGLSEGTADYWAQSYTRSLGYSKPGDPQYDQFALWGGQPKWKKSCIRITNYQGYYPGDLTGEEHTDGQMWSSSLMSIYDRIGRKVTDRLLMEALSMLTSRSNQRDAAHAFMQADNNLYNGEHLADIIDVFVARGYLMSQVTFDCDVQTGHVPLVVQFTDSMFNPHLQIINWEWDFDNDGSIDAFEPDPEWTYHEPGKYSISLKVSDGYKSYEITREHYIHVFNGESALAFNGKSSRVKCEAEEELNITDAFTFEAWIKPEDWGSQRDGSSRIFSKFCFYLSLVGEESQNYAKNSALLFLKFEGGSTCYINTAENTLSLNEWQHIAATYNSKEEEVTIYIDGIRQSLQTFGSFSGKIEYNKLEPLIIGNSRMLSDGFNGVIDEVCIWNRSLMLNEIHYEKNNNLIPSENGLIAYFQMNEGVGNVLTDLTGHGHMGTSVNTNWVPGFSDSVPLEIQQLSWNGDRQGFELVSNYPNPFNSKTVISYKLPVVSDVELNIYDVLGQKVATLTSERQVAGSYDVEWDASGFSSGTYFYRIEADKFQDVKKMILLR